MLRCKSNSLLTTTSAINGGDWLLTGDSILGSAGSIGNASKLLLESKWYLFEVAITVFQQKLTVLF